ncbi:ribose-phosphate diphosphokinase [Oceanisphaera arctica]|uniref:Ribose-phosphate pyrophosphokinase n=1 Tax=Oceanisphaera arctica TaxID=641510 RepID=A0A2P5TL86_9GAMM|nr:ribose-phosphate diphosphokinase [Oceanisphaera arctica]PPL16029.1 ribose-phosphate pyrophosphokinase [Oceanisphaera arctica]GHA15388.1 phosphoribosylpyrophosphate synthetase [Oceanisphaera arctica]
MMPLLFSLDDAHPLLSPLCRGLHADAGRLERRRFPDGESYLRIHNEVTGRPVLVLADLSHPDDKFLPLSFLCDTLKEMGASQVGLVAPYLCYMRQDCRFHSGEAVTSRTFARLLSQQVDWLVTVDPHLHRYHSLDEIYRVPSTVVQAAPLLADWLGERQEPLLLVGPDAESEQWVSQIAARSGHDYVVGSKVRSGDRQVTVQLPDLSAWHRHTALIIDDVISSGQTVLRCLQALRAQGLNRVDCAAIHGLFADRIEQQLTDNGLRRLITTNAITHPSNTIDLSPLLLAPIRKHLAAS